DVDPSLDDDAGGAGPHSACHAGAGGLRDAARLAAGSERGSRARRSCNAAPRPSCGPLTLPGNGAELCGRHLCLRALAKDASGDLPACRAVRDRYAHGVRFARESAELKATLVRAAAFLPFASA